MWILVGVSNRQPDRLIDKFSVTGILSAFGGVAAPLRTMYLPPAGAWAFRTNYFATSSCIFQGVWHSAGINSKLLQPWEF